jgi:hypothetical protein
VEDRVFEDCVILGPAVIFPSGENTIIGGVIEGDPESLFWKIDPSRPARTGAVVIRGCTFRNCRFVQVGFVGTADTLEQLRALPVLNLAEKMA